MTATSSALDTALAYHHAWTSHDFARAMTFIADDIRAVGPAGPIPGAAAFRDFMEPFSRSVIGATVIAAFGDDHRAVVMYDTRTPVVASAPAAEHVVVVDGQITDLHIVFDRLPFDLARRAAGRAG